MYFFTNYRNTQTENHRNAGQLLSVFGAKFIRSHQIANDYMAPRLRGPIAGHGRGAQDFAKRTAPVQDTVDGVEHSYGGT